MQNDTEKTQISCKDSEENQILAMLDTVENLNGLIDRLDREIRVLEVMRSAVLDELDAISSQPRAVTATPEEKRIEYPGD